MLPFESNTTILFGLTSIRPLSILFLIPTHTRSKLNVHPRRRGEPKAFSNFDEIEFVDVKH